MKEPLCRVLLPVFLLFVLPCVAQPGPADEVNPLIGTGKSVVRTMWESNGATFPGVLEPHGMVQIAPDGYHYTDTYIRSFSLLGHGSGWSSNGQFKILPFIGGDARPSRFDHLHEAAHPWQYDVDLADYGIHAAFTATVHAGFGRFHFPASSQAHILVSDVTGVKFIGDSCVTGNSRGTWFVLYCNRAFKGNTSSNGPEQTVRLDFETVTGEIVDLRIGFSLTSPAAAETNLRAEIPDFDFAGCAARGRVLWNDVLGKIEIKGGDEAHRTVFYTALYHTLFMPSIESDAGVSPRRFSPTYPWDTYRSEHPLTALLDPVAEGEIIASTLEEYDRTGWLPTGNMLGNHNVELILDAYVKGVRNFDAGKAATAIRKSLLEAPYGRRDMAAFNRLGYVSAEHVNSVSQTLEFAYNDWAGGRFLKAVGESHFAGDADTLLRRGFNYQHVFDPEKGFMRAKTEKGVFTDGGYCEGTAWTYTWYVPHDVGGLVDLMGGAGAFSSKLSECFDKGYYVHDNEPPLHYAYLFDFIGQPWKTQAYARQITEGSYHAVPGGLPGNDDLGALSSWYVFSAMGFYPVTPGLPQYELGSPVFDVCVIHLPNGKTFTIRAPGTSAVNKYIRGAVLNGKRYERPWIGHETLMGGGEIVFTMGALPNEEWGVGSGDGPPSLSGGKPRMSASGGSLHGTTAMAGDTVLWSCLVKNKGDAAGGYRVELLVDGRVYGSRSVVVGPRDSVRVTIPVTLYRAGAHRLAMGRTADVKRLWIKAKPASFSYGALAFNLPPVLRIGDSLEVSTTVRNTGSVTGVTGVDLVIDGGMKFAKHVRLRAGVVDTVRFTVRGKDLREWVKKGADGVRVGLGNLPGVFVRYIGEHGVGSMDAVLLRGLGALTVLDFEQGPGEIVVDRTGLGDDGIIHGTPHWVSGLFGKAIQLDAPHGTYIQMKAGPSLDTLSHRDSMTLMAWIYPMDEENFADIVCRGDWHTLQLKASNTVVNYYSLGWEGHEAFAAVPVNWNRHWHHIAGVTRGETEELYIDGRLVAEKHMEPRDPRGETGLADYSARPWSVGRNDGDQTRVFKGYIDDVMIFGKALRPEDISRLMLHLP